MSTNWFCQPGVVAKVAFEIPPTVLPCVPAARASRNPVAEPTPPAALSPFKVLSEVRTDEFQ
jgi:hypothetical protein